MDRPKEYCKDCFNGWVELTDQAGSLLGAEVPAMPSARPAPNPGPRCATHWRAERKRRATESHARRVNAVYGLQPGQYEQLFEGQGRHCAICLRANGKTKRLAVDHNHKTGEVRGLLCGPCNSMLAHARDEPDMFHRARHYLIDPPSREVFNQEGWWE